MANSFSLVAPKGVVEAITIDKNGNEHKIKGEVLLIRKEDGTVIDYPLVEVDDVVLKVNWNS